MAWKEHMGRGGVIEKLRIMDGVRAEGAEPQPVVSQAGREKDSI